jgi:hypothetical protein
LRLRCDIELSQVIRVLLPQLLALKDVVAVSNKPLQLTGVARNGQGEIRGGVRAAPAAERQSR